MKRSEINTIMRQSVAFLEKMNLILPPFAFWGPDEWEKKGTECADIIRQQLGWDITDFGSGTFEQIGLFMFCLRNGTFDDLKKPNGKVYAEKILIVRPGQVTPIHFHYQKMEDIINRGGGVLKIKFWNATPSEELADTDVTLSMDGVKKTIAAGEVVDFAPGESVCIPQKVYHTFWGDPDKGTVLVGEVSRVNDDYVDNHFYEEVGRFATIEEDEKPLYLLYDDYETYYPEYSTIGVKA